MGTRPSFLTDMLDYFQNAWTSTHAVEKGYVDDPNDSGGKTNHGITERLARKYGYTGDMKELPESSAYKIAKQEFWDVMNLDDVAAVHPAVAFEMFDTGFLCGSHQGALFFQEGLNALNRQGKDYPDLVADGKIGAVTVAALRSFISKRSTNGVTILLRVMNSQQCEYLRQLTKVRPKDEDFFYGWVSNRVVI